MEIIVFLQGSAGTEYWLLCKRTSIKGNILGLYSTLLIRILALKLWMAVSSFKSKEYSEKPFNVK